MRTTKYMMEMLMAACGLSMLVCLVSAVMAHGLPLGRVEVPFRRIPNGQLAWHASARSTIVSPGRWSWRERERVAPAHGLFSA